MHTKISAGTFPLSESLTTLYVPTFQLQGSNVGDLVRLWELAAIIAAHKLDATLDFSRCTFLSPVGVGFLGGVVRHLQYSGCKVIIKLSQINDAVKGFLISNGFLKALGLNKYEGQGSAIPYTEFVSMIEKDKVIDYLQDKWLGRGWVKVSEKLSNAIAGQTWEIFTNAFEHSKSSISVIACGQFFPKFKRLVLTVNDCGVGIPNKVRDHLGKSSTEMNGASALAWAFTSGNTTDNKRAIPRGLGLSLISEFVKINGGYLNVYSNDGAAHVDRNGMRFSQSPFCVQGTFVEIQLVCDENYYCLAKELSTEEYPLF